MFNVDNNGNITLVQGDNGSYIIDGLPTDKSYSVYFAIQDKNRNPVGEEIIVPTERLSYVDIDLPATLTDLLTVNKKEETEQYYFGLKICDNDGYEDTLLIGESDIGDKNTITVYPKKVEGV